MMRVSGCLPVLLLLSASGLVTAAGAADGPAAYPDHTVRLIIGFPAGGSSDTFTRLVGGALAEKWGQTVVVENRPGASGHIAGEFVAKSKPDGYTLLMVTKNHAIPPIGTALPYDPVRSFALISLLATKPLVLLVHPSLRVNSVKDLVTLAKAKPGSLNFGTSGPLSEPAMTAAIFMQKTGTRMTGVAYQGGIQSQLAVRTGEIELVFGTLSASLSDIKTGALRALAVTTGARSAALPNVPTLAESAPELQRFDQGGWNGIMAPAGTAKEIVARIYGDLAGIMKVSGSRLRQTMDNEGSTMIVNTPEQFAEFLVEEMAVLSAVAKTITSK